MTDPAVDGRAGLPQSAVSVVKGHASRDKVLRVEGLTPAEVRAALGVAEPPPTA